MRNLFDMSYFIGHRLRACAAFVAALLPIVLFAGQAPAAECVPVGVWSVPGAAGPQPVASGELLARLARQAVVLLGESHDSVEDHRWQLQTLAELHAFRPRMVLGFEMFPRRVQPVLDRWVAGEYTETEFLKAVDWYSVWNFDPQLYLPIFHFARMNRIPMVAMNVSSELIRAVSAKGFDGVAADQREGITNPRAPSAAHIEELVPIYREHLPEASRQDGKTFDRNDAAFRRFIDSQLLWDRAMAQAIADAALRPGAPLVVGLLGLGHLIQGHGVPYQLDDLGIGKVSSLLPWRHDCTRLTAGFADAVFGVATVATADAAAGRPRLGVRIELREGELRVVMVEKGSIAEAAGMRDGDVISEAAGIPLKAFVELREITQRQSAGTWLPLKVKRQNETVELIAKFPPAKP